MIRNSAILAGYRMYLNGASDSDLADNRLSASDILFIKKFHECAEAGANLASLAMWNPKRSPPLLKGLFAMFLDWKRSRNPKTPKYESYPHLMAALSVRLDGASGDEMRAQGFTDCEISIVDKFLRSADRKIPIYKRRSQLGLEWIGVARMMQIYQAKRAEVIQ